MDEGKFFTVTVKGEPYYFVVRGVRVPVEREFRVCATDHGDAVAQAHEMMLFEIERTQKKLNERDEKAHHRMAISVESKGGVFTVVTHGMKSKGGKFDAASKLMDYIARDLFGKKEIFWSEAEVPEMDHEGSCYEIIWSTEGLDTRCYVPNGLHRNLAAQRVYDDMGTLLTCMGRWAGAKPYVDTMG